MKKEIKWVPFVLNNNEEEENYDEEEDLPTIVHTPFGFCKLKDNSILEQSKIWIANTNFKLTKGMYPIMKTVDGIESIKPITRYRLAVIIGDMFNDQDVQTEFYKKLCPEEFVLTFEEKLNNTKLIASEFPHWVIYAFPNGKIHSFKTEDKSEFEEQLKFVTENHRLSNGILLSSNDKQ